MSVGVEMGINAAGTGNGDAGMMICAAKSQQPGRRVPSSSVPRPGPESRRPVPVRVVVGAVPVTITVPLEAVKEIPVIDRRFPQPDAHITVGTKRNGKVLVATVSGQIVRRCLADLAKDEQAGIELGRIRLRGMMYENGRIEEARLYYETRAVTDGRKGDPIRAA